jgi:hypothetical protein
MTIMPKFPFHNDSISVEWLATDTGIKVQFKARATRDDLAAMFDALDYMVDRWDRKRPFLILVDTRNEYGKPEWTPAIRGRSLHLVNLAMSRGLMASGAVIMQDHVIGQIIRLFFNGVQPFTVRYKLKVAVFNDEQPALAWLHTQQMNALAS